ncbi:hypothetical protein LOD99_11156 [Oopsacas minuta]|uniref:AIG1-type G domain-containing protein n=1 Tax=Oopsacas minuta TaxID=111878 RepID=A0AAV7K795_9METZ|nr:hypothetical protein LOD99_11156 [Oopsacas minuta]
MGNTHGGTVARKKDYDNYTVMLVGNMGAGKSSLGNFLLKKEHFVAADSLARVTDKNMCECTSLPDGLTLRIIDTPGFGDFRKSEEVKRDLADAFYEAKDGVDAFLFVISSAERIGKEKVSQFEMFKNFNDHEHFYDYVIPVFTKVDQRLQKKGEKDIYSYEKQERLINSELESKQLDIFRDKIIARTKQNWMCISSTSNDEFYYRVIIKRLIQTIESIRIERHGMVCTSNIMDKARVLDDFEKERNRRAEQQEVKRVVVGFLLHILLNQMQGDDFDEIFGDDKERQKRNTEKKEADKTEAVDKERDTKQSASKELSDSAIATAADIPRLLSIEVKSKPI